MKKLVKSFYYALCGCRYCLMTQRNFRIHLFSAFTVGILGQFYQFTKVEWSILLLVIVSVMGAEIFNTALEFAMDRISKEYDSQIRVVKDVAAAGVLVFACAAILIGALFFLEEEGMKQVFAFVGQTPFHGLGALLYFALGYLFVFYWGMWKGKRE